MSDTAITPPTGSIAVTGKAPSPQQSNSPTIVIPYGSVVIASYPALLQRWTTTAAATTTWSPI